MELIITQRYATYRPLLNLESSYSMINGSQQDEPKQINEDYGRYNIKGWGSEHQNPDYKIEIKVVKSLT